MADLSHLEKMGRELKCPICLSLLKSSVSLPCNHVFCNSCVVESMKSISDCPVCKVPFRRREVRPAPHMDNLVSVFKGMEVAAGVNILTTQGGPSTKSSGDTEKNSGTSETKLACQGRSKGKGLNHKTRQKLDKSDQITSDVCPPQMPSFPAKKRVHVNPYMASESDTPLQVKKVTKLSVEFGSNKVSNEHRKKVADGLEDPLFMPFFCLREDKDDEDEDDEASGKPSDQLVNDASQPYVPCFSDIKDSEDDNSPAKMTATRKSNVADALDSELFEWTQMTCSPELYSTPLKGTGKSKFDANQEKDCQLQTGTKLSNGVCRENSAKSFKIGESKKSNQRSKNVVAKKGSSVKSKKPAKTRGNRSKKTKIESDNSLDEAHREVLDDAREIVKDSVEEDQDSLSLGKEDDDSDYELPNRERRFTKRGKSPSSSNNNLNNNVAMAEASGQVPIVSSIKKIQNQDAKNPSNTDGNDEGLDLQNKSRKRRKLVTSQPKQKYKKLLKDCGIFKIHDEEQVNTTTEVNIGKQGFSSNPSENRRGVRSGRQIEKKQLGESKGKRKRKIKFVDEAEDDYANGIHLASPETGGCDNNQTGTMGRLRKCGNHVSEVLCAFCRRSNDTKDSGEMMHYFNGKPVAADNNGSNVIHSHKHCTEWAPDVYFEEDDLVRNLEAEVSRSRRIKCSCCGVKGAALGCYEKSCRKSFHFTCAKLVPECRWDNDNFVMLCPLHFSSNLPNEVSQPLMQRRKRPDPKESNSLLKAAVTSKDNQDMSQKWSWPFGTPSKWVLCCSALTATEKDVISEFTRLTGITISKSWSPAVTHVIASADEQGACKRTLKYLMGILNGKWILSIEWIKACMKAMKPVEEESFEIMVDVHGITGGPRLGRLRGNNKELKLFINLRFYLSVDFTPKYKGYLQDLITAAGGSVLQRKPLAKDQEVMFQNSSLSETFIIYSIEISEKEKCSHKAVLGRRRSEAQALANASGARVADNSWIIDSIAASKLQPLK